MIMNFFSGVFERALPTKGLKTNAATKKIPIRTPVSISLEPDRER
jgi:hypothetical protein